jgi:hypothetical protein
LKITLISVKIFFKVYDNIYTIFFRGIPSKLFKLFFFKAHLSGYSEIACDRGGMSA